MNAIECKTGEYTIYRGGDGDVDTKRWEAFNDDNMAYSFLNRYLVRMLRYISVKCCGFREKKTKLDRVQQAHLAHYTGLTLCFNCRLT